MGAALITKGERMIYRYYAETGGWRFVVLFHEGRKWLKLLDASRLEVYRIAKNQHHNLIPYRPLNMNGAENWDREHTAKFLR